MQYRLPTLLIVLAIGPLVFGQERSADSNEPLYGIWEVEEMIFKRTVQDFGGMSGGWFEITKDGFERHSKNPLVEVSPRRLTTKRKLNYTCIIRHGEMDIRDRFDKEASLLKAKYELKDGKLRVAWQENGERPDSFDEAYKDRNVTLFVLKKVK